MAGALANSASLLKNEIMVGFFDLQKFNYGKLYSKRNAAVVSGPIPGCVNVMKKRDCDPP